VDDREGPGQPEAGGAGVDVGLVAEAVGAGAEQLGGGVQLAVHLQADDHLPALGEDRGGRVVGSAHRVAPSRAAATLNMVTSSSALAITCTPTGSPSSPVPKGTDMAGCPARFEGIVHTSFRYMASGSAMAPSSKAVVGEVGESRTSQRS